MHLGKVVSGKESNRETTFSASAQLSHIWLALAPSLWSSKMQDELFSQIYKSNLHCS